MTSELEAEVRPRPFGARRLEPLRIDAPALERVVADGRRLTVAGAPFRVHGVTYGSFRARRDGQLFPEAPRIREDLRAIADAGLNTVRTYTVPPEDLLDTAGEFGLRVLAGIDYADWRLQGTGRAAHRAVLGAGLRAVDEAVARLAGRPTVLALSVGNEVPGDLVRLHGITPVERVLSRLVDRVHEVPDLLATYASYPTTEYLSVDGLDLLCFNVFLEDPERLRAYLRHLLVVAGDRPLLVTELGLPAEVHGEREQADALRRQLAVVDEVGCAGATVFAWTDEWGVAGESVEGWGFGVTRADRRPKRALAELRAWSARDLRGLREHWPALSVVVCAYNEERLLAECLDSLAALDYPELDVVVCDDGSTDRTLAIARRYPFRVLDLPHGGLSAARNAGARAARGEYVAYLDADASCTPQWPYHLVLSLEERGVVATGGPNLPVPGAGLVERAVAASPGGPVEVLSGDDRAEHVPGCNMAFRRDELLDAGGFDAVFTSAGDDVDLCWRLLDRGGAIGFAAAAQVRHHRRSTIRGYLRQQRGYGRSERMVASRHAHRFNRLGQARWAGAIYGGLRALPSLLRPVVYHGYAGGAPYQKVVAAPAAQVLGWWAALLPLTVPLAVAGAALGAVTPAGWALTAAALTALLGYAAVVSVAARPPRDEPRPLAWRALVTFFHVAQPLVRAWGRLRGPGLPARGSAVPSHWSGDRLAWLTALERELARRGCSVAAAGPDGAYDLQVSRGPVLAVRVSTAVQWGWTPQVRTAVRLRPLRLAVLLLAAAVAAVTVHWAVAGALAAAVLLADAASIVPTVRAGTASTTRGALVAAQPGDGAG
jgi:glycosyltransferase involved in cell wall biosynthesis/exo-beta-1,3-glucanase (GH17 family)